MMLFRSEFHSNSFKVLELYCFRWWPADFLLLIKTLLSYFYCKWFLGWSYVYWLLFIFNSVLENNGLFLDCCFTLSPRRWFSWMSCSTCFLCFILEKLFSPLLTRYYRKLLMAICLIFACSSRSRLSKFSESLLEMFSASFGSDF